MKMKGSTMYATIAILCFVVVVSLALPKTCNSDHASVLDLKAMHSRIIDSIQKVETAKLKKNSDSLISIHNKKDSIAGVKIAVMEKDYKRLRAIVRHLTSVRVDSISQIVIVPVEQYNAFVESGNKCDSMQVLQKFRIAEKDSVNMQLAIQVKAEQAQNITTSQALTDQTALTTEEKEKVAKGKKINKVLTKIIVVETAILIILAIVI